MKTEIPSWSNDPEVRMVDPLRAAATNSLLWPHVFVDRRFFVAANHWYYRYQPAEMLLARRLASHPDLLADEERYGPFNLTRSVEILGLNLPHKAGIYPDRALSTIIDMPQMDARLTRSIAMDSRPLETIMTDRGPVISPLGLTIRTGAVRNDNWVQGYNMNGPEVIIDRADYLVELAYSRPHFLAEGIAYPSLLYLSGRLAVHDRTAGPEDGERFDWQVDIHPGQNYMDVCYRDPVRQREVERTVKW